MEFKIISKTIENMFDNMQMMGKHFYESPYWIVVIRTMEITDKI